MDIHQLAILSQDDACAVITIHMENAVRTALKGSLVMPESGHLMTVCPVDVPWKSRQTISAPLVKGERVPLVDTSATVAHQHMLDHTANSVHRAILATQWKLVPYVAHVTVVMEHFLVDS
ncbi:uncharacterized protein [Hetaerina americana]|uniref:uncharacterized protein n=1 Tax=Hetaerina americana TaxID=62018 RepID=UPI003A7F32B7